MKDWLYGAIGGFVGSFFFGLIMQFVIPAPMLEMAIPAMYGVEGPALLAGWAFHQFHGVALGLVYVALVQIGPLTKYATNIGGSIGLGIAYGVLTAIAFGMLLLPIWLRAVGFPNPPPLPNVSPPGMIGHIVYAVPLAVIYAIGVEE